MCIYYQNTFSLRNNENFQNTKKQDCFGQLQNPKVKIYREFPQSHSKWKGPSGRRRILAPPGLGGLASGRPRTEGWPCRGEDTPKRAAGGAARSLLRG